LPNKAVRVIINNLCNDEVLKKLIVIIEIALKPEGHTCGLLACCPYTVDIHGQKALGYRDVKEEIVEINTETLLWQLTSKTENKSKSRD
jgi:hypothetical protein